MAAPLRPSLLLAVCLLAIAASAQRLRAGECPGIEPITDFNATAFSGLWYENRKYVNRNTIDQKCVTVRFSSNGDGVGFFDSIGYEKWYEPVRVRGFALQPFGSSVGAFSAGVPIAADTRAPNVLLIDVQYDRYAVLYSCRNKPGGLSHLESLWVLARTPQLPKRTLAALMLRLHNSGIKGIDARPTEQRHCPDNTPTP